MDRNPALAAEIEPLAKELRLRDGSGSLRILPAKDVHGAHGKTYNFLGIDELHTSRSWDLLEALAPDPTRTDALRWITSYDTIYNTPGVPLYDLKQLGKAGTEPRMLFSWYSGGELNTDPAFAELEPELRANPSFGSLPEGRAYLDQQRRILPTHKFRRLHLNLPGAPEGAFLDQGKVLSCVVRGRKALPREDGRRYFAFVDMSGGSSDDAVMCVGHAGDDGKVVIDRVEQQAGDTPFRPQAAVQKFASLLREYGLARVTGDRYGGTTFVVEFGSYGISQQMCPRDTTALYEALEPVINDGGVELPDEPKLQEQLVCLVIRGAKVTHPSGDHDDYANAVAGCVWLVRQSLTVEQVPTCLPVIIGADGVAVVPTAKRAPAHTDGPEGFSNRQEPWRGYVTESGIRTPMSFRAKSWSPPPGW